MRLLDFIVNGKILIGLLSVLAILFGSYSVFKLDKELLPDIKMNGAFIRIDAGEMTAPEVERTVTTPLEQEIKGLEGIADMESTSTTGQSTMYMTFDEDRGEALFQEVEAIVNSFKTENQQIKDTFAQQFGTSQDYEFFMDLTGENMEAMTAFAKNVLKPRLEQLPEVRDVNFSGTLENEVNIKLDPKKLQDKGIDASQIIASIQEINNEAAIGELTGENDASKLRWNTKLENLDDVKNMPIATPTGFITLKDVAAVTFQPLKNSSSVWKNGTKDFIFIEVGRAANVTQLEMAEAVRAEVEKIRDEKQINGFELNEVIAQADYVKDSIDGVTENIIYGGIIAILVLLLFLRNVRATFIIGLSIPTAILLTFTSMLIFGYSFNMLTLIGLGLGIGMLVDASIVILESIYRKKEQGLADLEAVLEGTKEVSAAVIASMLTTVAVFLPIGMISGEIGQFVMILSIVVAVTLISSVIVAFTLIPALAEKMLKLRKPKKANHQGFFMKGYKGIVAWTVQKKRNSLALIILFAMIFAGSLLLAPKIPMNIMPDIYNRYNELMIEPENGLSTQDREKLIKQINNKLQSVPDVESTYVLDDNGGPLYVLINMTKGDAITLDQVEVNVKIMKSLRELKETEPVKNVITAMGEGGGTSIAINIKGEEFDQLKQTAAAFTKELGEIDGVSAVSHSMEHTAKEQLVQLKQDKMEKAGLASAQLKQYMVQSFLQIPVGEMQINDTDVPITINWDKKTDTEKALLDLEIPAQNGMEKLSSFITLKTVDTPNEISHLNGDRIIMISAEIEGKDLGAVNRSIQKVIDDFEAPSGYSLSVAGDLEQQQELMQEMLFVLGIAIFLVFLVMAVQFNHLGHPLIVMSIIPMTIVGVILGLFVTGMELNILSGMGLIMLIGIVLNNAILLIDRTNQLRKKGYSVVDALVTAGEHRIRPIFMTTLTTAGGMLPLALASGTAGNYQAPLATVIITGLLFATFITLLLIPAVYRLFTIKEAGLSGEKVQERKREAKIGPLPHNVG